MNSKKVELVEINIDLNTGFNMFLNPNTITLRFNRVVRDSKPKNKVVLGRETTHKESMAKSSKNKQSK
jgi:urocanate hydratase